MPRLARTRCCSVSGDSVRLQSASVCGPRGQECRAAVDTMSVVDALGDVLQPDGVAQSSLVTMADMERQERLIIGQMQVS